MHKIGERHGTDRQTDKDALDVLRLLRGTETEDLAVRYRRILADKRSREAAEAGRRLLEAQFVQDAPALASRWRSALLAPLPTPVRSRRPARRSWPTCWLC